jgi:hypothetical protein
MIDMVRVALDVLAEMGRSDINGHVPHPVYCWLATTGAHLAIGMMLGLRSVTRARARVVVTFFALWAAKELSFDLPDGGWSPLTWADSIADLAFARLGLLLANRAMSERGS